MATARKIKAQSAHEALTQLVDELNASVLERAGVVQPMVAALIAQEHVLLLGLPGTAKSMIARKLAEALSGTYFELLLGKFTVPEEVWGPVSVSGLQQDRYERVGAGKMQEAQYVVLDEIFKSSSALLNSFLAAINERIYHDGTRGPVRLPLEMVVAASNELPQEEGLEALYDRFLVRIEVKPLREDASFEALLQRPPCKRLSKVTEQQLADARQQAAALPLSKGLTSTLASLRRKVQQKGVYVSDRRWLQALGYLRAVAWLQGFAEVSDDQLEALKDCLWDAPEQRAEIVGCIMSVANPQGMKAQELADAAEAKRQEVINGGSSEQLVMAGVELKRLAAEIAKLEQSNPSVAKAHQQVVSTRKEILRALNKLAGAD